MTIKTRAIEYVTEHPNSSAWFIARAIGCKASSVSSALCKAVKAGELARTKGVNGTWLYRPAEKLALWEVLFISFLSLVIFVLGITAVIIQAYK